MKKHVILNIVVFSLSLGEVVLCEGNGKRKAEEPLENPAKRGKQKAVVPTEPVDKELEAAIAESLTPQERTVFREERPRGEWCDPNGPIPSSSSIPAPSSSTVPQAAQSNSSTSHFANQMQEIAARRAQEHAKARQVEAVEKARQAAIEAEAQEALRKQEQQAIAKSDEEYAQKMSEELEQKEIFAGVVAEFQSFSEGFNEIPSVEIATQSLSYLAGQLEKIKDLMWLEQYKAEREQLIESFTQLFKAIEANPYINISDVSSQEGKQAQDMINAILNQMNTTLGTAIGALEAAMYTAEDEAVAVGTQAVEKAEAVQNDELLAAVLEADLRDAHTEGDEAFAAFLAREEAPNTDGDEELARRLERGE